MDTNWSFRQMLKERQRKVRSIIGVGLDPLPEKMPESFKREGQDVAYCAAEWMKDIVDKTATFASMFKPQIAHWEALSDEGTDAMAAVIKYIKTYFPDIPVFLDCKRGDIGRTQQRYRKAIFEIYGAHGANFSPYMGEDCLSGLVDKDHPGRALVGLGFTSNPAAREVQNVLTSDGKPYWEYIVRLILSWAEKNSVVKDAGLVMAAAYETPSGYIFHEHLERAREIVGNKLWFLIPGIGAQGGVLEETIKYSECGYGSIVICSSSEIDFAPDPAAAAKKLRDEANKFSLGGR